jgi:hypothetical protein
MKHLLFFILTFTIFSCEHESVAAKVTMTYHMTQCGDPWMSNPDYTKDKVGVLTKFLTGKQIQVLSLKITTDCGTGATCAACICKGCDTATVEVPEEDVKDMEALKFVKK